MIREKEARDTPIIMDIWLRANIQAHPFLTESYWQDNQSIVEQQYLPIADTLVAEIEGRIAGFISIIENSFIGALFIDPKEQGKGLGASLIQAAKERYSCLELGVYAENERAVSFYARCGFAIKSKQPNEDSGHMEYTMIWSPDSEG